MRIVELWNDNWEFTKEGVTKPVTLPHTWNAVDGQDGGNDYYRGVCWYRKSFSRPVLAPGEELWVEFRGAASTAEVYLNGKLLGVHEGGYSTFRVELTDALEDLNVISLAVSNAPTRRVYPQKADFTFYGGIYRDVYLITVPHEHFELGYFGTPGIKVTPVISEDLGTATVTVETYHNAKDVEVTVNGETQRVRKTATFTIKDPHLWDGRRDPYLYTAAARLPGGDEVSTQFGIRKIAFDANRGFILNNNPLRLVGAARHQDRQGLGSALTKREHEEDIGILLEMGANTVRLAHYQQDQYVYELCDRAGLVVWAEIPYITEHMPEGRENTLSQMRELVTQCYNHPSIVCWGLSNEITATTGVTEDLRENHMLLNDLCHRLDPTRPTAMAHVFMLSPDDPFVTLPDIRSFNLYYGWYVGGVEQNDEWFDSFHAKHPETVMGLSEYGADANPRYQSARPEKGDWTEGYQAVYHEHMLKMWSQRPWIWAMHCWNGFDFAADGRDEGGKPGQNQKGLVTFDRKIKKDAFFIYKAYLSDEPFVHLCGRRYADRAESETEIRVYSNQKNVTLFVDGAEFASKSGDKVFKFTVPITGEHEITVKSGTLTDTMTVHRVDRPNRDYIKDGADIVNWFDRDDEIGREGYFSIRDSMGDIKADPRTQAVMEEMVAPLQAKLIAAYGDVAKNVRLPPEVQAMMDKMSVEQSLKQMGSLITPEFVHKLNHALNQIKKGDRDMRHLANPMNIEYKYQFGRDQEGNLSVNREAADPSLVLFKGIYYLYPSMTCGFWWSEDLESWKFHALRDMPVYDYAPDVRPVGEWLYFCASSHGKTAHYRTRDPFSDEYEKIDGTFPFWDPNLFEDEDGRLYFYHGSSPRAPIYGVELDRETLEPLTEQIPLFANDEDVKGFERRGEDHIPARTSEEKQKMIAAVEAQPGLDPRRRQMAIDYISDKGYIEGAWMTKHNGKYYLQYAFAGAQFNIYGDGVYVSDKPLGPFVLAKNNPFSYKPGGFIPGAGHGSTLEDKEGHWWHISTMRISLNHVFERRLGIWPAGWDEDGEMFCNQRYGDWVYTLDRFRRDIWAEPEWMLLSYGKTARASSEAEGCPAANALDENIRTWWKAADAAPGQWLEVDLGSCFDVRAVQVNFADDHPEVPLPKGAEYHGDIYNSRWIDETPQPTRWLLEGSADGESWFTVEDRRDAAGDLSHDLVVREAGITVRFLKLTVVSVPYGQAPCVSGLRVFGIGGGKKPGAAKNISAERKSGLDVDLTWEGDAMGYEVLFGYAPDRLYHSYEVFDKKVHLGGLVAGQELWVRVDSFNESGITHGEAIKC